MWTGLRRAGTIGDRVDRFRKVLNKHESIEMADGDCLSVFVRVSTYLSLRVCEIRDREKFDDEIYRLCGGDEQRSTSSQWRRCIYIFLKDYVELYCDIIEKYRPVDVIGDDILKKTCEYFCNKLDFLEIIAFFIISANAYQVLLGLELFKIVLCGNKDVRELGIGGDLQILVYNLKLNYVKKGRVAREACNLARECFEKLCNPFYFFVDEIDPIEYIERSSFETKKKFLSKLFRLMVYDGDAVLDIRDQYYVEKIFMSAKTSKERDQYMETLLEAFDNNRRGQFRDDINYEFGTVVNQNLSHLAKCYGKRSQEIEDELRCIDKYQGIKIDPYDGPNIVDGAVVSELSQVDDAEDLIVEKCTIYDNFMRYLQILTILHTAFLRREEIYWICKGVKGDHKEIFRSNVIESYVCGKLSDKSKCGDLPWYIEMIIRKCPFVVFKSPDQDIIDGLIKILKKEYVDEDLEIKVYEAIKPVDDDHGCSPLR